MNKIIKKLFDSVVRSIISISVLIFYSDLGVDKITIVIGFVLMIWAVLPFIDAVKLFMNELNSL